MDSLTDDELAELRRNVLGVLTPAGLERWWDTRLPRLGMQTPRQALAAGQKAKVLETSRGYLQTAFS